VEYRFSHRRYRLPFRAVVRTAHGPWAERDGAIVRVEDEAGRVGYGEAAPLPRFGTETIEEIDGVCRGLGGRITAQALAEVPARLGCLRHALGAAIGEWAEADGAAVAAEANETLTVSALLPAGRAVLEAVKPKLEIGFRTFKWKVGVGDPADEISLLDDLCAELPEGAKLRLDANGAWDRRKAERWLERCAERPVEFVEQPIAADARGSEDLLRGLAADFPVTLALDESLVGEGDVMRWLGLGWPGVYVLKLALVGDPAVTLARLAHAKAAVVFSSSLETAVGARTALRHAFAWKGARRALGYGVWPLFADRRFDGPAAAPFLRRSDLAQLDPEAIWTALD